jgi:hypothetical protein
MSNVLIGQSKLNIIPQRIQNPIDKYRHKDSLLVMLRTGLSP